jgi:multiple sugar transport system ATP-binding protein
VGSDGRPAIYGIRPEHLVLSGTDGMPAEVSVLEPTGQETQVFAKVGTHKIVAVFRQRLSAKPGETLPMMPEIGLAHLFDEKTGARIG